MSTSNGITFDLNIKKKNNNANKSNFKTFEKNNQSSDDENEVKTKDDYKKVINEKIKREQQNNYNKMLDLMSKNIEEDPSICEYDSLYDQFSTEATRKKEKEKIISDKPKYLHAIIDASEKRKIEQSISIEKVEKIRREREKNDFEDMPKFVTRGYEEKMAINKMKNLKNILEEKYDKVNSIENKEMGMMGFYSNLLTKNKSLGSGFRGETDDTMLKLYQERKSEFNQLIDKKINEFSEEKDLKITVNKKKKFDDEKEDVIREIKSQMENKISPMTNNKDTDDSKIAANTSSKVDDIKQRYLERKRHREAEPTINLNNN